jgi:hypothetical protein
MGRVDVLQMGAQIACPLSEGRIIIAVNLWVSEQPGVTVIARNESRFVHIDWLNITTVSFASNTKQHVRKHKAPSRYKNQF